MLAKILLRLFAHAPSKFRRVFLAFAAVGFGAGRKKFVVLFPAISGFDDLLYGGGDRGFRRWVATLSYLAGNPGLDMGWVIDRENHENSLSGNGVA